ncbi:LysR family transcriptional regulator [Burkholderia gladioli]|uniref:LysR family transcriptional regulator n=1 Tax=Burkholderia gladioli TaxID=28095 RepID=UPI00163E62DD|nr:LysR family transcriptional regulator [Burkholderia gladioli]
MTPLHHRLKLRHVAIIIEVARQGSLLKAADVLSVSQSAVSKSLAETESIIGAQLFERTPSGMRATSFGQVLVRHGHLILGDVQRAQEELEALRNGDTGAISVGVFLPLGWWGALADCVNAFRVAFPRVRLSLREDAMENMIERLDQDTLDVVIGRLASGHFSDNYQAAKLRDDHPCFVARKGHRLLDGPATLESLLDFPLILPAQPNIVRQQLEFAIREMGMRVKADIVSSHISNLMLRTVGESDALLLVPGCVSTDLADSYGLRPVDCRLPFHLGPLVAVTRADKPPTPALAQFMEVVLAKLRLDRETASQSDADQDATRHILD